MLMLIFTLGAALLAYMVGFHRGQIAGAARGYKEALHDILDELAEPQYHSGPSVYYMVRRMVEEED